MNDGFCREQALHEPLAGTGQDQLSRWVLLEDGAPWGAKVPRDSQLPIDVQEWLGRLDAEPHTRVQLIRRPRSGCGTRRRLFVVEAGLEPGARKIVELDLELDAIPSVDPGALLAAAPPTLGLADLWLVCTHGARDRCCAKWGIALWEVLRNVAGQAQVWQSSHLGGHRFAPSALCLPSGLLWGRLAHEDMAEIVAGLAAGELRHLERLRGRCAYPKPVQAGESLLRARLGVAADEGLRLLEHEARGDGSHHLRFALDAAGSEGPGEASIVVERPEPGLMVMASCGDEPAPRRSFRERPVAR